MTGFRVFAAATAACGLFLGMPARPATAADASAAPMIGPEPAWVKPLPVVKPSGKGAGGPVRYLSDDIQIHYGEAADEVYEHRMIQVSTTEGLAVGNVTLAWNPETDALMVHHLRILRGSETIDVLAAGQTFTVLRRESNMERAMLDGALTAAIQPEGLQVGDILDLAFTIKRHDPTMQGRSELITNLVSPVAIDDGQVREMWPASKPMRWRRGGDGPQPKVSKSAEGTELVFSLHDLKPPKYPERAPVRFLLRGRLEATQFVDWAEISTVMAPLYDKASTLGPKSALKVEADKIAAQTKDPKARAALALRLVQDRVRYLYLGMNLGAYTPADADVTWGRRFGDCKGKTAVLLALLKELGVEAQPAFVSTRVGDGLDERLPTMESFDHVLVRAHIDDKTYWLDGTRSGDTQLDRIAVPPFHWALPVQASGAKLEKLVVPPLDQPNAEIHLRIDATGGIFSLSKVHVEDILRGDLAETTHRALANMSEENLKDFMKVAFTGSMPTLENDTTDTTWDADKRELRLIADGSARVQWYRQAEASPLRYEIDLADVGSNDDFKRERPEDKDLPFVVDFPSYATVTEEIQLPRDGKDFTLSGANVDTTLAGVRYQRTSRMDKGLVTIQVARQSVTPEITAAQAGADKTALRTLLSDSLYVVGPVHWRNSAAENAVRAARPATSSGQLMDRAEARLYRGELDKAFADLDAAIKLKPDEANVYNARCYARAQANRDLAGALDDCNQALKISPRAPAYLDSRGLVEWRMGKFDEALKDYDQAVALNPDEVSSRYMRGLTKLRLGKAAEGEADIKAAIALDPNVAEDYAHFGVKS